MWHRTITFINFESFFSMNNNTSDRIFTTVDLQSGKYNKILNGIKLLSLDCFDTLIWRRVHSPSEIFKQLEQLSKYRKYRITAEVRVIAERKARDYLEAISGTREVSLYDIYATALPHATGSEIEEFVECELAAEMQQCFVFKPILDLAKLASQRGIPIVVASDMYLGSDQVEKIVSSCLLKAGEALDIKKYYTSSEHKCSKASGLLKLISKDQKVEIQYISHIGDNINADYHGPNAHGAIGYHFIQYAPWLPDIVRRNHDARRLLAPDIVEKTPTKNSWNALWATAKWPQSVRGEVALSCLAPVIAHYIRWVINKNINHACKYVFLMRDGYFPFKVAKLFEAHGVGHIDNSYLQLSASRFSTFPLRFTSPAGIAKYLSVVRGQVKIEEMIHQFSLDEEIKAYFTAANVNQQMPYHEFAAFLLSEKTSSLIIAKAKAYRENFKKYITKIVNPTDGEIIVIVDLGYSGTIQDNMSEFFQDEYGVALNGAYLILKDSEKASLNKRGFISGDIISQSAINFLLNQIQTLEQLTVNDSGSTCSYDSDGLPVYEINKITQRQIAIKSQIQDEALEFLQTALSDFIKIEMDEMQLQLEALGMLGRLTMFPTSAEMDLQSIFAHDINNGTNRFRLLTNKSRTEAALKKSGTISFNPAVNKMFTNDLNNFGPQNQALGLIKGRYSIEFELKDYVDRSAKLEGIVCQAGQYKPIEINSFFTYDGFRVALVSYKSSMEALGLSLGKIFKIVQIHSIELVDGISFASNPYWSAYFDLMSFSHTDQGLCLSSNVYEFASSDGFINIDLKSFVPKKVSNYIIAFVYRPIEWRN